MKTTDIKPGLVYAVPANRMGRDSYGFGNATHVREGHIAVPFKVDRIGKFRKRQSGACTTEIVENHYTLTVVGSFPDVPAMLGKDRPKNEYRSGGYYRRRAGGHHIASSKWPGYPNGLGLTGKKMKWREEQDIVTPNDVVMPWADFLMRRYEWVFVATEIAAYQARHKELIAQVRQALDTALDSAEHVSDGSIDFRVPSGQRLTYDHGMLMFERSYKTVVPFTNLPLALKKEIEPMLSELADIQRRLECAV
jgi:hypothetical protein